MAKTDSNTKYKLVFWGFLLLVVICALCSCSSVRKLKKNVKQTEQVKTSEQTTKVKDSSTTTTISKVDSSGTTVTVVFDNDGKDTVTTVEVVTYPSHKEDYYQPARTEVKTNRKPKSITVNKADKKEDKQEVKAAVKTNETKAVATEKKTTTQTKEVEKKKFVFHWWWLLIALAVVLIVLFLKYNITPATAFGWLRKQFTKTHNMKLILFLIPILLATGGYSQEASTFLYTTPAIGNFDYSDFANGKVKSTYDTTVLNKGVKDCNHNIVGQRIVMSMISCLVYHGAAGCPNDWMNRNFICTVCLFHFNVKESRTVIKEEDQYEEAVNRLSKAKVN